jgi:hypothetical protein
MYISNAQTAAAAFTLNNMVHYYAQQATLGAGSAITNQYGFFAELNLVGATNNYGFFGVIPSGTNRWNLYMNGTANNYLNGSLGIGSTSLTLYSLRVGRNITGGTFAGSILSNATVQSDVTSDAISFYSLPATAAAAFTLTNLTHFYAQQSTIGSTSAVTNQYGFLASSSMTGATNNYGFYGAIPSGTNRWNLYMNGTANNYMAGSLGIGSTSLTNSSLNVSKTITGSTTSIGIIQSGAVQSGVTSNAYGFYNSATTQAAAFTLGTYIHYGSDQSTIGAGSAITTQIGFNAAATLIGATNNYGFQGNIPSGTNRWNLYMAGTAANYMAGRLGLGLTATSTNFATNLNITGGVGANGIYQLGVVQSDVTAQAYGYRNLSATQAASFTLTDYFHYASLQGSFGAGSTVTNQYGFYVDSTLVGATNDYGFYGNLAAATNVWNLYMNGTAANYMAGVLTIGTAAPNASAKVQIDSTTSGFLPPRMTSAQRTAIATPAEGLIVVQTDGTQGLYLYIGAAWHAITML